jgi:hypothetical protein
MHQSTAVVDFIITGDCPGGSVEANVNIHEDGPADDWWTLSGDTWRGSVVPNQLARAVLRMDGVSRGPDWKWLRFRGSASGTCIQPGTDPTPMMGAFLAVQQVVVGTRAGADVGGAIVQ